MKDKIKTEVHYYRYGARVIKARKNKEHDLHEGNIKTQVNKIA
jgi:hypothetical protein